MAAVLACGPGAVLSHGSALSLWDIWTRWDRPLDITVQTDRRPRGIRVHRSPLGPEDTTRQYGIPVTTLARTLLDEARRMRPKSLTRAINDGRQARHVSLDALVEVIQRYPNHRSRPALEYSIGVAPERPLRSGFEGDFSAFCERYGLPTPQMDAVVCGYEVDALFREEKVIVELDGWNFHWSRFSFESDRDRDADTAAAGFLTVRITWERIEQQPQREARRLQAILARRRGVAA